MLTSRGRVEVPGEIGGVATGPEHTREPPARRPRQATRDRPDAPRAARPSVEGGRAVGWRPPAARGQPRAGRPASTWAPGPGMRGACARRHTHVLHRRQHRRRPPRSGQPHPVPARLCVTSQATPALPHRRTHVAVRGRNDEPPLATTTLVDPASTAQTSATSTVTIKSGARNDLLPCPGSLLHGRARSSREHPALLPNLKRTRSLHRASYVPLISRRPRRGRTVDDAPFRPLRRGENEEQAHVGHARQPRRDPRRRRADRQRRPAHARAGARPRTPPPREGRIAPARRARSSCAAHTRPSRAWATSSGRAA